MAQPVVPAEPAEPVEPGRGTVTTRQAADLLGVKPETVYAYVSRGLLTRHRTGRGSIFERAEVEELAGRRRSGRRSRTALEIVVDTSLTLLDPSGRLFYRGHDAIALAGSKRFEQVAALLWNTRPVARWTAPARVVEVARRAAAALPRSARPTDRMRVALAAIAPTDPARDSLAGSSVVRVAQVAIVSAVEALPVASPPAGTSIAHRLWARLSPRPPGRGEIRALNAALVLLADHELAASTLAARVAASVHADPYLVLLTGASVVGGVRHGATSLALEELLRSPTVLEDLRVRLDRGDRLPGFGHKVYAEFDPRTDALVGLVARAGRRSPLDDVVVEVEELVRRTRGLLASVDFALAYLTVKAGLAPGSGEAIFLLARMAGVIAHALEEYPYDLRFRPRALYTGP